MNQEPKRFEPQESPSSGMAQAVDSQNIWYKNKILWICLAVPLLSLAMGFVTLFVAIQSGKSPVLEGYYKEGFAPKQIAKSALAKHIKAEIVEGVLLVHDPEGISQQAPLWLKFEHPTLEAQDQLFELKGTYQDGIGHYPLNPAMMEMLKRQHWYLRLYDQNQRWQIKGLAHPLRSHIRLEA
ncbi:MAG: FixH family protein [Cardiobacteriaceae bacterium]|nr:FixH family protein [Cardiobacteriaceae bacterium]